MAGAWGCPHEEKDKCSKVNNQPCNPGMKGCVLAGRYFFFNDDAKNERLRAKLAREAEAAAPGDGADTDDDTTQS
jgi:L-2-hydroxyglutarate oxidase LhgO